MNPNPVLWYWLSGAICGVLFMRDEIWSLKKSYSEKFDWKRISLTLLAIAVALFNSYIYYNSTERGDRLFDPFSMVVFGLFNGLLETFLFFTCFKLGEWLAGKVTQNKFALFFAGLICFMIYSGIAHSQFWMHEFPQHLGTTPDKLVFRQFFFPVQFSLAISWALIYFIYRDFWTVVFIHIYIDMCVIYSIHYSILFR